MSDSRNCKAFMKKYSDLKINCATCRLWGGIDCDDEERVVKEHEANFYRTKNLMENNQSIYITP